MGIKTKLCALAMIILSAQAGLIPFFFVTDIRPDLVFVANESNDSPFIPDGPSTSDEDSSGSVCLDLEEEMLQPHSFQLIQPINHPQPSIGIHSLHIPLQGGFNGVLKPPQFV